MTDGDLLLKAIRENPEEDTPRLAFADWLEEHGGDPAGACEQKLAVALRAVLAAPGEDGPRLEYARVCDECGRAERAEYIRYAVERCLPPHEFPTGGGATVLLHSGWGGNWKVMPKFRTVLLAEPIPDVAFTAHRGFIEGVACSGSDWEAHGDAILAAHPVRRVAFAGRAPAVKDAAQNRHGPTYYYAVAGKTVGVPKNAPGGPEDFCRLILSARWPQVPPEGWAFPAAGGSVLPVAGLPPPQSPAGG